ncbi:MAG: autophagy protein 17 [Bogoriella megaspora]|nr:MAG: autophagy protein 17 [Bogoriella megaspora]
MMTSTTLPSSKSPSPSQSLHSSTSTAPQPLLERLVNHFVQAKKSLSCTTHVWRANEIVNTARTCLEENAVLRAKNTFVRRGLGEQLGSLRAVLVGIEGVGRDAQGDLKTTVAAVDAAHARLQDTLAGLRNTVVAPSLQPIDADPKSLLDFVDESPIASLSAAIRRNIDNYKEAAGTLSDAVDTFASSLDTVERLLPMHSALNGREFIKDVEGEGEELPIPRLYRSLETHATEMADSLQSLVKHYDLCVTALKHTEGGGEAARQAAEAQNRKSKAGDITGQSSANVSVGSLQIDAPPLPITDEERLEMMQVLDSDAAEVDDVVSEIGDRSAAMEEQVAQIEHHVQVLEAEYNNLRRALKLMAEVCLATPRYVTVSAEFLGRWEEEKASIKERMEELDGLSDFYEEFLRAYDGLVLEVVRRRKVKEKMSKIARDAESKIQKLYQEEIEEREAFRADHGVHLPVDIWPGLTNAPTRLEFRAVDEDEDEGSIPELSKDVVDATSKRTRGIL